MPNWNDYKEPNIGLLFYKHIYQESSILAKLKSEGTELSINIPTSDKTSPFDSFYKEIYNRTFNATEQIENTAATQRFDLFTTYPGLLSGSGYQHDTKAKGDFKIGFFFDHSTGQPILPGSSVKGVLHSLFEMDNKMVNDTSYTGEQSVAAIQFICESLIKKSAPPEKEAWGKIKEGITEKSLKTLADAIFGTQEKEGTDIFYDAVIHIAKSESKDKKFLAPDYITPHENPLKNPIPLLFLKVLPNVAFQFRFRLKDNGDWTAQRKELFFKEILLTIGIGAKTNVGYGQFSETPIKTIVAEPIDDRQQNNNPPPPPDRNRGYNKFGGKRDNRNYRAEIEQANTDTNPPPQTTITKKSELREKALVSAKVIDVKEKILHVSFELEGATYLAQSKSNKNLSYFKPNEIRVLKIVSLEDKKNKLPIIINPTEYTENK